MPRRLILLCLLAGLSLSVTCDSTLAQAQTWGSNVTLDATFLNGYRWRSIGPAKGGRSIATTGVKGRRNEAYFGATGGGLWKTADYGLTWTPVTDGQITSSSVGAVAVSNSPFSRRI